MILQGQEFGPLAYYVRPFNTHIVSQWLRCPPGPTREELVSCWNIPWSGAIQCFISSGEAINHFLSHSYFHLSADPQTCRSQVAAPFSSPQSHWELHALPNASRKKICFSFIHLTNIYRASTCDRCCPKHSQFNQEQTPNPPSALKDFTAQWGADIHTICQHSNQPLCNFQLSRSILKERRLFWVRACWWSLQSPLSLFFSCWIPIWLEGIEGPTGILLSLASTEDRCGCWVNLGRVG